MSRPASDAGSSEPPIERSADRRSILLTIEYDGTDFHGWQEQRGLRTVQGEVQAALGRVLGQDTVVEGASRTDRGVHARGQAAVFSAATPIPTERLPQVVNAALPRDVRLTGARAVPDGFSARRDAIGKVYRYSFLCARRESAFLGRYTSRIARLPDIGAMRQAALALVGVHDFKSFRTTSRNPPLTTVREIFSVSIDTEEPFVHIAVAGSGFLYNMVRNIAGTLLEVGYGRRPNDSIPAILAARDRRAAGATAEARGLCLVAVAFEREELLAALAMRGLIEAFCPRPPV